MNHYTELLNYIIELAGTDPLVNKVTQGNAEEIDFNKMNLTPLVHISIGAGSFTNGSSVVLNVELAAVALVDVNTEINTDQFYFNNNRVDNLNECLAILNRIWSRMATDFEKKNIIASENPGFDEIEGMGSNALNGWNLSFTVEMPNKQLSLCQYPIV
jgi:uncharacterized Ntn-hydrolase superfamily protein